MYSHEDLNRAEAPDIRQIDSFSIASPEHRTLSNGIPIHIIDLGEEEVVKIDVVIHSGTIHQDRYLQANFTNAMLQNSTKRFTQLEINEKLDFYGAWLRTGVQHQISVLTLFSLNKYFDETFSLVESMLKEPLFLSEELQLLAQTRKQQFLVSSERVSVLAYRELCKQLYGEEHVCGRTASADDYDTIASEDLYNYHRKHYHSGNCSIYVSGKVTPAILESIEQRIGKEKWGEVCLPVEKVLPIPAPAGEKRVYVQKDGALQSAVFLGMLTVNERHPDYSLLLMATTLLGGYFGSRLMSNIREDKGYTYGISAFLQPTPDENIWIITAETDNKHVDALIKEVYIEMDKLRRELVSLKELEMVRNYMLGTILRSCESAFSLSETYLSNDVAQTGDDFLHRQIEAVKSATPETIRAIADSYFCKDCLIEVIAGEK